MVNRVRNKQVVVRLTEEEALLFEAKCKESGLTKSAFIMKCVNDKEIVNVGDREFMKALYSSVAKVGNNLNQIAKALHESKYYDYKLITNNMKECDEVWQLLKQFLKELHQ